MKSLQAGMKRTSPKPIESKSPVRIEVQNSNTDVPSLYDKTLATKNYIKPTEAPQEIATNIYKDVNREPRRVRNTKEYDNYTPLGVKPGPKPSIGKVESSLLFPVRCFK